MDFNALLKNRPDAASASSLIEGEWAILTRTKYVISLDADTQLPRDTARNLVGTMAHLLNHSELDPRRNVVSSGYGILQPLYQ